jgi:hypothetical protein
MASCEKCWRDAGGDPKRYAELVDSRTGRADECTLEDQAGGHEAAECSGCHRKTVHCVLGFCINPECLVSEFPEDE